MVCNVIVVIITQTEADIHVCQMEIVMKSVLVLYGRNVDQIGGSLSIEVHSNVNIELPTNDLITICILS
jgi:hypothetical protein